MPTRFFGLRTLHHSACCTTYKRTRDQDVVMRPCSSILLYQHRHQCHNFFRCVIHSSMMRLRILLCTRMYYSSTNTSSTSPTVVRVTAATHAAMKFPRKRGSLSLSALSRLKSCVLKRDQRHRLRLDHNIKSDTSGITCPTPYQIRWTRI